MMNPSFASMPMGVQGGPVPGPGPSPPQPLLVPGGGQQPQLMASLGQSPQPPPTAAGGPVKAQGGPSMAAQVPGQAPGQVAPSLGAAPGPAAVASPAGVRMASAGPPPALSSAFPAMRPFPPQPMMPNYMSAPPVAMPQMMPPGVLGTAPAGMPQRYSAPPYNPMGRPSTFVPRPPLGPPPPVTMSAMSLPRPPGNGLRPIPPVLKPPPGMSLTELAAKGVGQLAAAPEKPHTTVYVGKIAPTIEDDFLRALLELCGDIKSWKRAQDPTTGSPKGFGFCEFDSAEGVLRALRILNKFNLEGQELVLNVNQATREYLERYVAKKKETEKFMQQQAAQVDKDEELAPGVESVEAPKTSPLFVKDDGADKGQVVEEDGKKFGLVSAADIKSDELAFQKLSSMLEERSRLRPLPPPPPLPIGADGLKSASSLETISKSRDGDLSVDAAKSDDPSAKNDDDTTSDHRASVDNERSEQTSADKGRRTERDRERDREREIEREKERELERYERERERERQRRERERDMRLREAERLYEEREREWESREREKERQRGHDREREKDRERDRRKEIKEQEEDDDDEDWKKSRYRSSLLDEKRKRRLREREEDFADRVREEQEVLSKRQKIEERAGEKEVSDGDGDEEMDVVVDEETNEVVSPQNPPITDSISVASMSDAEEELPQKVLNSNGTHNTRQQADSGDALVSSDADMKASPAPRKLGFGIMGSGRRATGLSVFHQEDEEEKTEDRRLRPLVPIDYSAEEMQAVATPNPARPTSPQVAPNLAAAAEFARSLSSNVFSKEDRKEDSERDRSRRKRDRPTERDMPRKEKNRERDRDRERDREREDRDRDRDREKDREKKEADKEREKDHVPEKIRIPEPKKILNAKQLIDTIPKTKEELFAYPVDWNIYDKHDLHEKMRPWISRKITEFLGEEETTLVDFIVSNTCKHVTAANMLELLESILDDEAELFVLKLWRMLIFEVRRIETGLASSRAKS